MRSFAHGKHEGAQSRGFHGLRERDRTPCQEQQALQQECNSYNANAIRIGLIWEPSAVRAEVERFLADEATPGASIPWVEAEATAIIDRRRAERDAAAERQRDAESKRREAVAQEAADRRRRKALLRHGVSFVNELTADREEWDADDAEQAVEEVREHLADVVEPTWSKKRVEREVADVLEEWE